MHDQSCHDRVTAEAVEERLRTAIGKTGSLWSGAQAAGANIHKLPRSPRDMRDTVDFRFAVLGPEAASSSSKPSKVARSFLDYATGPDSPRVYRNALVLAVPSPEGVDAARSKTRSLLGWEDVQAQLNARPIDPVRRERLRRHIRQAEAELPGVIRQAYGIVVTVNERNVVHAFKLPGRGQPLFEEIKSHGQARIVETRVNPEALLPDGPYRLWEERDDARLASQLSEAFARFPRLPKVLKPELVTGTVLRGVRDGLFAARLKRPDGSVRTWWREDVESVAATDDLLEIVLPEKARLARLDHRLLRPGTLPDLWIGGDDSFEPLALKALLKYFAGGHVAAIAREGYEDRLPIPSCPDDIVVGAVAKAVADGTIWVTNPPATVWKEPIPAGTLNPSAELHPAPEPVAVQELTEEALPEAWSENRTSGLSLTQALGQKRSAMVPWGAVREGIAAAVNARWLVRTEDSGPIECTYDQARKVILEKPKPGKRPKPPSPASPVTLDVTQMQDLADRAPDLLAAIGAAELRFGVHVRASDEVADEDRKRVNEILGEVSPGLKLAK